MRTASDRVHKTLHAYLPRRHWAAAAASAVLLTLVIGLHAVSPRTRTESDPTTFFGTQVSGKVVSHKHAYRSIPVVVVRTTSMRASAAASAQQPSLHHSRPTKSGHVPVDEDMDAAGSASATASHNVSLGSTAVLGLTNVSSGVHTSATTAPPPAQQVVHPTDKPSTAVSSSSTAAGGGEIVIDEQVQAALAQMEQQERWILSSSWSANVTDQPWLNLCGRLPQRIAWLYSQPDAPLSVWTMLPRPDDTMDLSSTRGLGDQLRGLASAFMYSMLYGRKLAIATGPQVPQFQPAPYGVEPNLFDWRALYDNYEGSVAAHRAQGLIRRISDIGVHADTDSVRPSLPAEGLAKFFDQLQNTSAMTVEVLFVNPPSGSLQHAFLKEVVDVQGLDAHEIMYRCLMCALRAIFRPTPRLRQLLVHHLNVPVALREPDKPHPPVLFVGVHARFGGRWQDAIRARNEDVLQVVECAWNMTRNRWQDQQRPKPWTFWLLASDNPPRLLTLVQSFLKAQLLGSDLSLIDMNEGNVAHVARHEGTNFSATASERLWLDFFMLAEADACAYIRSGFARLPCAMSYRRALAHGSMHELDPGLMRHGLRGHETYSVDMTRRHMGPCAFWHDSYF